MTDPSDAPPQRPHRPTGHARPSLTPARRAGHLFSLWTALVAQPFYSLMVVNPEFFAAQRAQPLDILTLVALLGFLVPALLTVLDLGLHRVSPRLGTIWHLGLLGTGFFFLSILSISVAIGDSAFASALALAASLLLAWAVWRFEPFSTLIALGALASVVFPVMFLSNPVIAKQVNVFHAASFPEVEAKHDIVILILDEFPTASLIDPDLSIDGNLFPNFARLAATSTWYRHASSVADATLMAVPAILTGQQPRADALPFFGDYPWNLLTLLAKSYKFHVMESRTSLCPPSLATRDESWASHMRSLLFDEALMVAHGTLPPRWKVGLPDISFDVGDFGAEEGKKQGFRDKVDRFRDWLAGVEKTPQRQLIFGHTILPHAPWRHLSNGARYADADAVMLGMPVYELWNDSDYLVEQNFQRHMLQATFVDKLLGEFLDKLEKEGLFQDSLVIVMADHGAAFVPGKSRRFVSKDHYAELLSMPLFIKMPQQHQARIDDRPVQTTDLLPSLVDYLDLRLDWPFDGTSFLSGTYQPRSRKVTSYFGEKYEFPAGEDLLSGTTGLKRRLFPPGSKAPDLFKFGPDLQLLGRPVQMKGPSASVSWDFPERYRTVALNSDFCPSWIRGTVRGVPLDCVLAVAVNGRVAATGRSYRASPQSLGFSLFAPPSAFHDGANSLTLYRVTAGGGLQPLGGLGP
jgi:hypothetical protein